VKTKTIEIPLWERDLIVMLGGNHTDIYNIAKQHKLSDKVFAEIKYDKLSTDRSSGGAYFCLEKGIGIFWVPTKRVTAGLLAHEATHIVDWVLEFIGAEKEMEARAYTVEWIVTNIPLILKKM